MASTKAREEQAQVEMSAAEQLAYLQAEQRRIAEQMKAAWAALPQWTPLEKEMARQAAVFDGAVLRGLVKRIRARMRLGQERTEALNEVMRVTLTRIIAALDEIEQAEAEQPTAETPESM